MEGELLLLIPGVEKDVTDGESQSLGAYNYSFFLSRRFLSLHFSVKVQAPAGT